MSYDEFEQLCKETWKEEYNYLCMDRPKKREQGRYCLCKSTYTECIPEANPF